MDGGGGRRRSERCSRCSGDGGQWTVDGGRVPLPLALSDSVQVLAELCSSAAPLVTMTMTSIRCCPSAVSLVLDLLFFFLLFVFFVFLAFVSLGCVDVIPHV